MQSQHVRNERMAQESLLQMLEMLRQGNCDRRCLRKLELLIGARISTAQLSERRALILCRSDIEQADLAKHPVTEALMVT